MAILQRTGMAIEGAHWIVGIDRFQTLWIDGKYSISIRGDTTVNGKNYKRVFWETFEFDDASKGFTDYILYSVPYALIRDDTLQRKVYAIRQMPNYNDDSCPEGEEYLLFDFSVEEGDTLSWCSLDGRRFDSDAQITADSIRFIEAAFLNIPLKTIYATFVAPLYNDIDLVETANSIIEGFGYAHTGPFLEGNFLFDYCLGTNWECGLLTNTPERTKTSLQVYPNPAKDVLVVEGDLDPAQTSLQIISPEGKMIRQEILHNHQRAISIKNLPLGIYMLRIVKSNRILHQSRLVKQ